MSGEKHYFSGPHILIETRCGGINKDRPPHPLCPSAPHLLFSLLPLQLNSLPSHFLALFSVATLAYFFLGVRDAVGIREQSTLWFLRRDEGSLSKQILCLPPPPRTCANGALCGRRRHFPPGGLDVRWQQNMSWYHFTHCSQDITCFSLIWAPCSVFNVVPGTPKKLYKVVTRGAFTWAGFEVNHTTDKLLWSCGTACRAKKRQLDEKAGQMFWVCLNALITKMCGVRELPARRFCGPSSRKVWVPKSTHYINWIRSFSLFPQRLHHQLGIKGLDVASRPTASEDLWRRDEGHGLGAGAPEKVCFLLAFGFASTCRRLRFDFRSSGFMNVFSSVVYGASTAQLRIFKPIFYLISSSRLEGKNRWLWLANSWKCWHGTFKFKVSITH